MSNNQFKEDDVGRTPLYYAVAKNDIKEVESIIFSLPGTGLSCRRLALLTHKDHSDMTAVDLAKKAGHEEIWALLSKEQGRMEFFE